VKTTTGEMPFLDHLEELRSRLIWSLAVVLALSVGGFFIVTGFDVLGILSRPFHHALPDMTLQYLSPTTPVMVSLKLGFVVGLILASPFLAWQAWAFFEPALYEHERRMVVPAIGLGFLLFLIGIAMAYFFVLPFGLDFLLGFQAESLSPMITVDEYLRFATRLILAFGLIFEMPVVFVLLSLIGLVSADTLRKYRRHAVVGLAAASALLTPADVGTMLMLFAPMLLLYEFSVFLVDLMGRRRGASEAGT